MTFFCSICKNLAGSVELLPPDHADSLSRNHTIEIRGFIGHERIVVSESMVAPTQAVLNSGDARALYEIEKLWAPFYCADCNRVYCVDHWTVVPHDDEGFFDYSDGYCPEGHRRMIED